MSGDYSRVRFDARGDIAGVLMQQGRVQLDSEWNEWVAVMDRRLRAESVDTFGVHPVPGFTGVAVVSPQTPDAFKIEAAGGNITIGRGRMYVDGLLAENHGGGTLEFDPVLAELRGVNPLAYNQQPYFATPPAVPPLPAGNGPHLAYLEVWQREVTYLQQTNLVESAVGVDTTTRWQTVWQVRFLANIGAADCHTPEDQFTAWQTLIRPSGGRLSIRAEGVPPGQDPCELPPTGGYRGLENQLYRIEIHNGGAVGAGGASFKWSRENASVASNVVEIVSHTATATELKLASLGRDAVLRFNTGDWVEILDDRRELGGENNDPLLRRGVMRKITVDDAKQSISFTPALPADLIPAGGSDTLAARHTRVKRWDQKGTVRDANNNIITNLDAAGSTGLIPVPAANVWVVLENGVQVQFSLNPAGTAFRCGDYWVSAARSADTSVETYTAMPPRGIHRHYARLAVVTFPDTEDDCRVHWPPACGGCCTITVKPGDDIQAALDALPLEGGCVCLKTGVHEVESTLEMRTSHVILRGEGPGAIVRSTNPIAVLQIGVNAAVSDIVVEGIRFEAITPAEFGIILYADDCTRLRVEHCEMAVTVSPFSQHVGMYLNNVAEVNIAHNRLLNLAYGIWLNNYEARMEISGNLITGVMADYLGSNGSWGQYGIWVDGDLNVPCHIANNTIRHFWVGIYLRRHAEGSLVADNHIHRLGGPVEEPAPTDTEEMRQYLDIRLYAIDVEAAACVVRGNEIDLDSNLWGGIRVSGAHVTVSGNTLLSTFKPGQLVVPASIYCLANAEQGRGADHVAVNSNQLLGPQTGIVISRINGASVIGNHIDGEGGGWYGVRIDECNDSRAQDNRMQDLFFAMHLSAGERNRVLGNDINNAGNGITSLQEAEVEISGNRLQSCLVMGMGMFVRGAASFIDNRLANCGYSAGLSFGIGVFSEEFLGSGSALVRIEGCEVIDTGVSADGSQITTVAAMGISGWVPNLQVLDNRVGYTRPDTLNTQMEHRAFMFIGPLAYRVALGAGMFELMTGSALVNGNHFRGPGRTTLVEFFRLNVDNNFDFRFEKVTFSNNICDHLNAEVNETGATVRLWGGHLIAMGNHVKGPLNVNSMALSNRNQVALMGNITTGNYIQVGTVTPPAIANFNVKI